jgi:N-acetylneuraminic acid mutarotase
MKRIILFILVLCPVFVVAQNHWTKKASFGGLKRERCVSFAIDSLGYVGMGEDTASIVHNDLWSYSPTTDSWTQVASMPASVRRNAVSFVIGSLAYVGTGIDSSESFTGVMLKDFWEYNPATNSWTSKADYPGGYGAGVYFSTGFAVGDKGYICGGKVGPSSYVNDLWEYKPTTDTWLQRASFPGGVRYQHVSLVLDLYAYVGFGTDENVNRKDWWQYNPGTNLWTQMNDFPGSERASSSTFVLGNRGYVLLGSDGGFLDETWEYNRWSDNWSIRANVPGAGRRNCASFAINNKGYAGMGKGGDGLKQSFYEYDPILFVGIEENSVEDEKIQLFPNPCVNRTSINARTAIYQYTIQNVNGEVVEQGSPVSSSFSIDVTRFQKGIYFVQLVGENSILIKTEKLVIE